MQELGSVQSVGQGVYGKLAGELATETMDRIQTDSVTLLQVQGKIGPLRALQLLAAQSPTCVQV